MVLSAKFFSRILISWVQQFASLKTISGPCFERLALECSSSLFPVRPAVLPLCCPSRRMDTVLKCVVMAGFLLTRNSGTCDPKAEDCAPGLVCAQVGLGDGEGVSLLCLRALRVVFCVLPSFPIKSSAGEVRASGGGVCVSVFVYASIYPCFPRTGVCGHPLQMETLFPSDWMGVRTPGGRSWITPGRCSPAPSTL